jgi:Contractile injection system tube protein
MVSTSPPGYYKADFGVRQRDGSWTTFKVQYNPNTLTLEKSPRIAEIPIPGLDAPLQQFVRGQAETLTVDLFFDSTETGTGDNATSVTAQTDKFYGMIKIDPTTHAPPVCRFYWNGNFPGDDLPEMYGNQGRYGFTGLVTKVHQTFSLFSPVGNPLRAELNLTMNEYRPLDEQLYQLNPQSADHTRSHLVADGDTFPLVAWQYLDKPAYWRYVTDANDIDDPRRIAVGTSLLVPAITPGGAT